MGRHRMGDATQRKRANRALHRACLAAALQIGRPRCTWAMRTLSLQGSRTLMRLLTRLYC